MSITVFEGQLDLNLRERLEAILEDRGWSQADLARASGISPSTINRILSGQRTGRSYTSIKRLSQALNLAYSDLTGEEDPEDDELETDQELKDLQMNALAIKKLDPDEYEFLLRQLAERRAIVEKRHKEEKERRHLAKRDRPGPSLEPEKKDSQGPAPHR